MKTLVKTIVLGLAALVLTACGEPRKKAETPSAEVYAAYIKAYTGGIVTPDTPIRIDLAAEPTAEGPWEADALFRLKPAVSGTLHWNSATSLSFVPDEGLKSGTRYDVSFALGKLLPGAPERFSFGLAVKQAEAPAVQVEREADNAAPFRVVSAVLEGDHVDVVLSGSPVNATLKGMVELEGAARSYLEARDSLLRVHYEGRTGDLRLTLDKGLKDSNGEALGRPWIHTWFQSEEKPAVEIPLQGNILPDRQQLILPFRAVNLSAVEVRVVKIYEKNVLMFLQENDLGGNSSLRRAGRLVYHGDVYLDATKDLHKWNEHSLDLSGLLKQEPGAIYRIRLSFRQDQSLYGGRQPSPMRSVLDGKPTQADEAQWDISNPYYWDNDYDWEQYDWNESEDPTKPSYYMESSRFPAVQLMASDLGLLAEYAGGKQLWVAATDLLSAQPVSGAGIEVYDYQLQLLSKGKTDGQGLAVLNVDHKPFAVVAKAGGSIAYLKVTGSNERPLSRFDVGGETLQQGLKAFLYGERGVWRPGDTVHLTMILSDKGQALPEGHPATLELYTPEGQFYARKVVSGVDGFYQYDIPTRAEDPTGYWNAYIKVGGSSFHKTLHIETVKPNRLKITTAYPELLQAGKPLSVKVAADWLSGGAAGNAPARVEMTLRKFSGSPFKGFEKYSFNNPSSNFTTAEHTLCQTRLSPGGAASVQVTLPPAEGAPGLLQAFVVTSVQEPGGDESFTTETLPYSPYISYAGIRIPDGDYLETDKDHSLSVAVVNAQGKRVQGHKVEYVVFKTGWNWWWDSPYGSLETYVSGHSVQIVAKGTLTSSEREDRSIPFRVDYPDWGRYLVLVRDVTSGHVSGRAFTVDWPEYRGRAGRGDPENLTMITLSSDKPKYKAGEKATVYLPAAKDGRALVSVENAAGVLRREWVSTTEKDTPWSFTVEPSMAPNVYVHVTLLQPYGASANDLPLRLYGVQRIPVENPDSHLEPVIQLPAVLHPEEPFLVKVSEKNGKPMTYTLAIVDEGLLDLTAFKTPDPWERMYRSEALGVKTWDLYDQVVGAFSGRFSPLAAIGGDEDAVRSARKDNRFNPVVLTLAPKTLAKGTDVLRLELPLYVGSVRVMLVAGHDGAFGNAEKTVPVQNPLMVVTTLPRVLGTGEEVAVPVNVFAMEEELKEASVTLEADGPVTLTGGKSQTVRFPGKGDQLLHFGLKGGGQEGVAHITVKATGAGYKATETLALEVRNPHPEVAEVERFLLLGNESRSVGAGTLQLTAFPALDARALYLAQRDYPYNCSEQLASRGLSFLHLIPMLNEADAADARSRIPGIVEQLYARQNADGGFAYWPGGSSNSWVSSMAGQFLTEAGKAGVEVNASVLKNWKNYQQKLSQVYRIAGNQFFSHLDEAYRLYTLALAGAPSASGMNRLREAPEIGDRARWMLSAAYSLSGKSAQAGQLLDGIGKEFPEYEPYNLCFGTSFRDQMVALDALALNGRVNDALALGSEALSNARHLSTQETAFAAIAYHHLLEQVPVTQVTAQVGSGKLEGQGFVHQELDTPAEVKNLSPGTVYGSLVSVNRNPRSKALSNGLKLEVQYLDGDGKSVNPASLQQGTRFQARIKVYNLSATHNLEQLALSMGIPSGWEILNERLMGGAGEEGYDYKDVRDLAVNWYFALPAGHSKTFSVQLRAAYEGKFVLPAAVCEAMYEPLISACTASGTAVVSR